MKRKEMNFVDGQLALAGDFISREKEYQKYLNERVAQYDVENLQVEDIISKLTGIEILKVKKSIDEYGLLEMTKFTASMSLTKAQERKLQMLFSFFKKANLSDYKNKIILNSSLKSGEYFVKYLQGFEVEKFAVSFLDSQNRVIATEIVSSGTINESPVYVREIVKKALNMNCKSIVCGHNHPAGSLKASGADIHVTKKIKEALQTVDIGLVDHIIVAENRYLSLAEEGIL